MKRQRARLIDRRIHRERRWTPREIDYTHLLLQWNTNDLRLYRKLYANASKRISEYDRLYEMGPHVPEALAVKGPHCLFCGREGAENCRTSWAIATSDAGIPLTEASYKRFESTVPACRDCAMRMAKQGAEVMNRGVYTRVLYELCEEFPFILEMAMEIESRLGLAV